MARKPKTFTKKDISKVTTALKALWKAQDAAGHVPQYSVGEHPYNVLEEAASMTYMARWLMEQDYRAVHGVDVP